MNQWITISRTVKIPVGEILFRFSRSGGPGGQNVNKVASKVELLFDVAHTRSLDDQQRSRVLERLASRIDGVGTLHVVVDTSRSQWANREEAVRRFAEGMANALRRVKSRVATAPTHASSVRRGESKRRRSATKRLRGRVGSED